MSGIVGIFNRNGKPVNPEEIRKMNQTISHRGPDGSAVWCEGPVGLGHQMLHTTPESLHEKLPYEEDGLVITADVRIDNRKELSELLELEDKEKISDSYFILKAYQKWGEHCPEHLLGDFAFAIWDTDKEELFCARDHMGVKPFYYYLSDDAFYFATEIKANLTHSDVPHILNELKVALFLMNRQAIREMTFYEDIITLTGAHSLKIDAARYEIRQYWKLDPNLRIEMDSDEEYVDKFREIFVEAIRCRLRSAFPIGFELSGGLDSSSIVCMSKRILNENISRKYPNTPLNTFSHIFNDAYQNERCYYIRKVLDLGGINSEFISLDKINPFEDLQKNLWYQEQPFNSPLVPMYHKLYKKIQKKKIRIVLNGEGGDSICIAGPNYFKQLFISLKWKKLIKEIKYSSKINNQNYINIFLKESIFPLSPNFLKKKVNKSEDKEHMLNKELAELMKGENLKKIICPPLKNANPRKYHYNRLNNPSHQEIQKLRDRTCSASSTETRYPFRDKRLVEFCYSLPNGLKFRNGYDKYLYRIALTDILPEEIQWRKTKHTIGKEYLQKSILSKKNNLKEIIHEKNRVMDFYVDSDNIKDIYRRMGDMISIQELNFLWFFIVLHLWLLESKNHIE